MTSLLRYRAILFDLDGTLVDSYSALAEAVNYARREHGLRDLGVAMAVCTNKTTAFSRKILEFLNLAPYFRAIVGPDLAGARKPDPRHVLRTLEATECKASEALFVGDMPLDVHAARNCGIDVAVVPTGSSEPEQLRAANPNHFLNRFADLLKIVRNGAAD